MCACVHVGSLGVLVICDVRFLIQTINNQWHNHGILLVGFCFRMCFSVFSNTHLPGRLVCYCCCYLFTGLVHACSFLAHTMRQDGMGDGMGWNGAANNGMSRINIENSLTHHTTQPLP